MNNRPTETTATSSFVNCSLPVECWNCKRVRPPLVSINIIAYAAGSVPSVYKPLCSECAQKLGRVTNG